jgi:hypothetical protein
VNANKSLLFYLVSKPAHGNLTTIIKIGNDTALNIGTYTLANTTYMPSQNFYGNDNFTFIVIDEITNSSNIGTVLIAVNRVNDPPIANAGADLMVDEGGSHHTQWYCKYRS